MEDLSETSPCPGLVSEYGYAQFEEALLVTDEEFSSIEDCQKVAGFYYIASDEVSRVLDVSSISSIVDSTWKPVVEEPPFRLMDAMLHWLKNIGFEEQAENLKDFARFLGNYMPSKEGIELFFEIMKWLIIAGTVGLVLREFYLAGMLRLPRFKKKRLKTGGRTVVSEAQWRQVIALPVREQVAALLRYSIQCLVKLNAIPASKSFTNRELASHLENTGSMKASIFMRQLQISEPVMYGKQSVTDEALAVCRQSAKRLRDA